MLWENQELDHQMDPVLLVNHQGVDEGIILQDQRENKGKRSEKSDLLLLSIRQSRFTQTILERYNLIYGT